MQSLKQAKHIGKPQLSCTSGTSFTLHVLFWGEWFMPIAKNGEGGSSLDYNS